MPPPATHRVADPRTGAAVEVVVETLVLSHFFSNCYLVVLPKSGRVLVIDPSEARAVFDRLQSRGWTAAGIVVTHGHLDHSGGALALRRLTGAPVAMHREDAGYLTNVEWARTMGFEIEAGEPDRLLAEGDEVVLDGGDERVVFRVLFTPGHSPGHITLVTDGFCFPGDVLFAGGVGRVDFPGGSAAALKRSIEERLLTLPDDTVVYPGHGAPTTIGAERRSNPFLTGALDIG